VSSGQSPEAKQPSLQKRAPRSLPSGPPAWRESDGPTSDLEFSVTGPQVAGIAAKLRAKTTGVSPFAMAIAVAMTMIGGSVASLVTAVACRIAGVTGVPVGVFSLLAPPLAIVTYVIVSCCRPVTQAESPHHARRHGGHRGLQGSQGVDKSLTC
jgi:hypothetical protein